MDRLFALWQAINPNSYVLPQIEQSGTFALTANSLDTLNTPLEPFAPTGDGPFFTSASARITSTFGYTYPEIQDWNQSPAQLKANVTAAINRLYNPNGARINRRGDIISRDLLPGQQTREWSVGLRVSKFDLGGERFIIRLFLSGVPEDPKDWAMASGCVGSFTVFPPPSVGSGPLPEITAFSEISLVGGLTKKGKNTQDSRAMIKYLKKDLQWRVQKVCLLKSALHSIRILTTT